MVGVLPLDLVPGHILFGLPWDDEDGDVDDDAGQVTLLSQYSLLSQNYVRQGNNNISSDA